MATKDTKVVRIYQKDYDRVVNWGVWKYKTFLEAMSAIVEKGFQKVEEEDRL